MDARFSIPCPILSRGAAEQWRGFFLLKLDGSGEWWGEEANGRPEAALSPSGKKSVRSHRRESLGSSPALRQSCKQARTHKRAGYYLSTSTTGQDRTGQDTGLFHAPPAREQPQLPPPQAHLACEHLAACHSQGGEVTSGGGGARVNAHQPPAPCQHLGGQSLASSAGSVGWVPLSKSVASCRRGPGKWCMRVWCRTSCTTTETICAWRVVGVVNRRRQEADRKQGLVQEIPRAL